MFSFLKPVKVNLTVELDPPTLVYKPGDTVRARFSVENDKELKIQGLRFTVTCDESYEYKKEETEYDDDGGSSRTVRSSWGSVTTELHRFDPLLESTLAPGRYSYETSFTLPANASASSTGKITRMTWVAKAVVDRKMAADSNKEVTFRVLAMYPPQTSPEGDCGRSNEPGEAQLSFHLPKKEFLSGGSLSGSLKITATKEFEPNEIRIELERREFVPDVSRTDHENESKTTLVKLKLAGKTRLQVGQHLEIPFSMALPADLSPSQKGSVISNSYQLKGILARTLRSDTSIEEEVNIYTGQ